MNTHYYPPQPGTQAPARISNVLLAGLITAMIITVIIASIIAYSTGYNQGRTDYIHTNCTSYPFLLIPSSKYWACRIPADQLPGSGQP